MRPIKFRAYDRIDERIYYDVIPFWEFVVLKYSQAGYEMLDIEIEDYDLIYSEDFSDYEIMQYTGLKDKNDVEIYEGDIVERTYLFNEECGETHTGEVVYDKDYARYVISRPQKYIEPKTEDLRNTLSDRSTYEVIGNIYENPELLEEEE